MRKVALLLAVWALALAAAALKAGGPAPAPETLAASGRLP